MNILLTAFRAVRRDIRRWQNVRRRERARVHGFPMPDHRNWSGAFLKSIKP